MLMSSEQTAFHALIMGAIRLCINNSKVGAIPAVPHTADLRGHQIFMALTPFQRDVLIQHYHWLLAGEVHLIAGLHCGGGAAQVEDMVVLEKILGMMKSDVDTATLQAILEDMLPGVFD